MSKLNFILFTFLIIIYIIARSNIINRLYFSIFLVKQPKQHDPVICNKKPSKNSMIYIIIIMSIIYCLSNLGCGDPINTFNLIYGLIKTNNLPEDINDIYNMDLPEILRFPIPPNMNINVFTYIIKCINENEHLNPSYIFENTVNLGIFKKTGSFYTPDYIIDYIFNRIKPHENSKILDPFAGSGAFTIGYIKHLQKHNLKVNLKNIDHFDLNPSVIKPVRLEMFILSNQLSDNVHCLNSLDTTFKKYDYVFSNPPFGSVDFEISTISKIKESLNNEGLAIVIVKEGFIFNKSYKKFRDTLNIKLIISLPNDIFVNTKVKTSIIIFDKNEQENKIKYSKLIIEKYEDDIFDEVDNRIILKHEQGDIKKIYEL